MSNIKNLSKLLIDYSLKVKPGQLISINGGLESVSLVKELYREIILRGAHPIYNISFEDQSYIFYKNANKEQLEFISPIAQTRALNINGSIYIDSELNTKELTNVDASKIATFKKSNQPLRDIFNEREVKGDYKWVVCPFPSLALAQDAEMSLEEYEEFVFNACGLYEKNPIEHWTITSRNQNTYLKQLEGAKTIRIVHSDDTDLTMNVEGRKFINCDGTCNMPDGEIYTSPIENSVNGKIYFDFPACYNGVEVDGVRLEIKDGIIINATANKNEKFLLDMIAMDEGSKFIGEFAFGLNYGITKHSKNILFDEKIGGTIHLAIGAGYPDAGGVNKSGLHWDIVKQMKNGGKVFKNDILIYENGVFI